MLKRTAAACVLTLVISAGAAVAVPQPVEVGPQVPGIWLPCFPWWCPEPPDCPFDICA